MAGRAERQDSRIREGGRCWLSALQLQGRLVKCSATKGPGGNDCPARCPVWSLHSWLPAPAGLGVAAEPEGPDTLVVSLAREAELGSGALLALLRGCAAAVDAGW